MAGEPTQAERAALRLRSGPSEDRRGTRTSACLPDRRHLAQPPDHRGEAIDGVLDLVAGREPAEAEPDRGRRDVGAHDGLQHVRRRRRRRAAGRSGRHGDVADAEQQRLAVDAVEAHVQVVRQPVRRASRSRARRRGPTARPASSRSRSAREAGALLGHLHPADRAGGRRGRRCPAR